MESVTHDVFVSSIEALACLYLLEFGEDAEHDSCNRPLKMFSETVGRYICNCCPLHGCDDPIRNAARYLGVDDYNV